MRRVGYRRKSFLYPTARYKGHKRPIVGGWRRKGRNLSRALRKIKIKRGKRK